MKRVAIKYVLNTFLGLALLSCKKDDNTTPSPKVNTFEAIEDIATFHGNFDGDIVVVNTQGGPLPELDDDSLTNFINVSESQSALFVNVHQVQTKFHHNSLRQISLLRKRSSMIWKVLQI